MRSEVRLEPTASSTTIAKSGSPCHREAVSHSVITPNRDSPLPCYHYCVNGLESCRRRLFGLSSWTLSRGLCF
jgi:hypothetical protein